MFEQFIAEAAREQIGNEKPLAGRVMLEIEIHAKKHRGDLSNCIKSIEDALNRIVYNDDKQIDKLIAERLPTANDDSIWVRVWEWCPQCPA